MPSATTEPSRYERYRYLDVSVEENSLATVVLNRPDRLNAVNDAFHRELRDIWSDLGNDPAVGLIIITGAGKAFCAGGDIKDMRDLDEPYAAGQRLDPTVYLSAEARRISMNLLDLDQPVIAAVNGDAIGLGGNLALMSDIVVMASDAKIADTHVKAGLVAGDGGAVIWPLLVGPHRAKEYLLRSTFLSGDQAAEIGLVNYAVARDEVLPLARSIGEEILAQPQLAVRWTKYAVNRWLKDVYHQVFDVGIAFEMVTNKSQDHREAVSAILEKREPKFTGR